ncbi:unnamed protein product [Amoebophrya sp. A25]|nr:unnamed protein product [Amoebophrya sp. A25]
MVQARLAASERVLTRLEKMRAEVNGTTSNSGSKKSSVPSLAASTALVAAAATRKNTAAYEGRTFVPELARLRQTELHIASLLENAPPPQAAQLDRVGRMVHDLLRDMAAGEMQTLVLRKVADDNASQYALMRRLSIPLMMRTENILAIEDEAHQKTDDPPLSAYAAGKRPPPQGKRTTTSVMFRSGDADFNLLGGVNAAACEGKKPTTKTPAATTHPLIAEQMLRTQARLDRYTSFAGGFSPQQTWLVGRIAELGQTTDAVAASDAVLVLDEIRELEGQLLIAGKTVLEKSLSSFSASASNAPSNGSASPEAACAASTHQAEAGAASRVCTRVSNLFMETPPTDRQADMLELMRDLSVCVADDFPGMNRDINALLLSLLRDLELDIVVECLSLQFPVRAVEARNTENNLEEADISDWGFAVRRAGQKLDTLSHVLNEITDLTTHSAVAHDVKLLHRMTSLAADAPLGWALPVLQDLVLLKIRELETGILRFARGILYHKYQERYRSGGLSKAAMQNGAVAWENREARFLASLGCGPPQLFPSDAVRGCFPAVAFNTTGSQKSQNTGLVLDDEESSSSSFLQREGIAALLRVQRLCCNLQMEAPALAQGDRALFLQLLCFEEEASSGSSVEQDPLALAMSRIDNLVREHMREVESEILLGYGNAVLATAGAPPGLEDHEHHVGYLGFSSLLPWLVKMRPTVAGVTDVEAAGATAKATRAGGRVTFSATSTQVTYDPTKDGRPSTAALATAAGRSSSRVLDAEADPNVWFIEKQVFSTLGATGNQNAKTRKIRELGVMSQMLDRQISRASARVSGRFSTETVRTTTAQGLGNGNQDVVSPALSLLRRAICDQKRELETEVVLEAMEVADHTISKMGVARGASSPRDEKSTSLSRLAQTSVGRIERCAMEIGKIYDEDVGPAEAARQAERRKTFFHTAFHFVEHIQDLADAEVQGGDELKPGGDMSHSNIPTAQAGVGRANELVIKLNAAAARQLQHLEAQSMLAMAQSIMAHHSDLLAKDARSGMRDSYLGGGVNTRASGNAMSPDRQRPDSSRLSREGDENEGNATSESIVPQSFADGGRTRQNWRQQGIAASDRTLARVSQVRSNFGVMEHAGLLPDLLDLRNMQEQLSLSADMLQRQGFAQQSSRLDAVSKMVYDVLHDMSVSDIMSVLDRFKNGPGQGPLAIMDGNLHGTDAPPMQKPVGAKTEPPLMCTSKISTDNSVRAPKEVLRNQVQHSESRLKTVFGPPRPEVATSASAHERGSALHVDAMRGKMAELGTSVATHEPLQVHGRLVADVVREVETQLYLDTVYNHLSPSLDALAAASNGGLTMSSQAVAASPMSGPGLQELLASTNTVSASVAPDTRMRVQEAVKELQQAFMCVKRIEQLFQDMPPNARQQDLFSQCLELFDGLHAKAQLFSARLQGKTGSVWSPATASSSARRGSTLVSAIETREQVQLLKTVVAQMKEIQREIVMEGVQRAHARTNGSNTDPEEVRAAWEAVNNATSRSSMYDGATLSQSTFVDTSDASGNMLATSFKDVIAVSAEGRKSYSAELFGPTSAASKRKSANQDDAGAGAAGNVNDAEVPVWMKEMSKRASQFQPPAREKQEDAAEAPKSSPAEEKASPPSSPLFYSETRRSRKLCIEPSEEAVASVLESQLGKDGAKEEPLRKDGSESFGEACHGGPKAVSLEDELPRFRFSRDPDFFTVASSSVVEAGPVQDSPLVPGVLPLSQATLPEKPLRLPVSSTSSPFFNCQHVGSRDMISLSSSRAISKDQLSSSTGSTSKVSSSGSSSSSSSSSATDSESASSSVSSSLVPSRGSKRVGARQEDREDPFRMPGGGHATLVQQVHAHMANLVNSYGKDKARRGNQ